MIFVFMLYDQCNRVLGISVSFSISGIDPEATTFPVVTSINRYTFITPFHAMFFQEYLYIFLNFDNVI